MTMFGINNAKKIFEDKIAYSVDYKEVLKDADVCFIFTEWDEINNIDVKEYAELMKTPIVYDGRNVYNVIKMRKCGVEYYSIGR